MIFRLIGDRLQVWRTPDAADAKHRDELLGEIELSRAGGALSVNASEFELREIRLWLDRFCKADTLQGRHALATLPEHMALAAEWFRTAPEAQAAALTEDILQSWAKLRKMLGPDHRTPSIHPRSDNGKRRRKEAEEQN